MEKFSQFNDPLTGINPFIAPKCKRITLCTIMRAMVLLPFFILYKISNSVFLLRLFIKIKIHGKLKQNYRKIIANSTTEFDVVICTNLLNIDKNKLIFPEGCRTNNRGILRYDEVLAYKTDSVVGFKYSPECIYLYGNYFVWLIRFLGNKNFVDVYCAEGADLAKTIKMSKLTLTSADEIKWKQSL